MTSLLSMAGNMPSPLSSTRVTWAKPTGPRFSVPPKAGISKFRHRKEESERRLQRTQENLVRINDKIGELELQVNPLREQAETARRFLLLRDEQRTLEISLWMERLEELRTAKNRLQAEYAAARNRQNEAQSQLDALYEWAKPTGPRFSVPPKITSSILSPRRLRADCSPMTQQMASEILLFRRYYRSGESEYYINKQSVRLKDVNELFMDT